MPAQSRYGTAVEPREQGSAPVWSRRFYVCAACVLMALALRLPVLRMAKPLGLDTGGKLGIGGVTETLPALLSPWSAFGGTMYRMASRRREAWHTWLVFDGPLLPNVRGAAETAAFLRALATTMPSMTPSGNGPTPKCIAAVQHSSIGYHAGGSGIADDDTYLAEDLRELAISDKCARGLSMLLCDKYDDSKSFQYDNSYCRDFGWGMPLGRFSTMNNGWRELKPDGYKSCYWAVFESNLHTSPAQSLFTSRQKCTPGCCYHFVSEFRDLSCILKNQHGGRFHRLLNAAFAGKEGYTKLPDGHALDVDCTPSAPARKPTIMGDGKLDETMGGEPNALPDNARRPSGNDLEQPIDSVTAAITPTTLSLDTDARTRTGLQDVTANLAADVQGDSRAKVHMHDPLAELQDWFSKLPAGPLCRGRVSGRPLPKTCVRISVLATKPFQLDFVGQPVWYLGTITAIGAADPAARRTFTVTFDAGDHTASPPSPEDLRELKKFRIRFNLPADGHDATVEFPVPGAQPGWREEWAGERSRFRLETDELTAPIRTRQALHTPLSGTNDLRIAIKVDTLEYQRTDSGKDPLEVGDQVQCNWAGCEYEEYQGSYKIRKVKGKEGADGYIIEWQTSSGNTWFITNPIKRGELLHVREVGDTASYVVRATQPARRRRRRLDGRIQESELEPAQAFTDSGELAATWGRERAVARSDGAALGHSDTDGASAAARYAAGEGWERVNLNDMTACENKVTSFSGVVSDSSASSSKAMVDFSKAFSGYISKGAIKLLAASKVFGQLSQARVQRGIEALDHYIEAQIASMHGDESMAARGVAGFKASMALLLRAGLQIVATGLEFAIIAMDRSLLRLARRFPAELPLCPSTAAARASVGGRNPLQALTDEECLERVVTPVSQRISQVLDAFSTAQRRGEVWPSPKAFTIAVGTQGDAGAKAGPFGVGVGVTAGVYVTVHWEPLGIEVGFSASSFGESRIGGPPTAGIGAQVWLQVLLGTVREKSRYGVSIGASVSTGTGGELSVGGSVGLVLRKQAREMCDDVVGSRNRALAGGSSKLKDTLKKAGINVATLGLAQWKEFGGYMQEYCGSETLSDLGGTLGTVLGSLPMPKCLLGVQVCFGVGAGVGVPGVPVSVDLTLGFTLLGESYGVGIGGEAARLRGKAANAFTGSSLSGALAKEVCPPLCAATDGSAATDEDCLCPGSALIGPTHSRTCKPGEHCTEAAEGGSCAPAA